MKCFTRECTAAVWTSLRLTAFNASLTMAAMASESELIPQRFVLAAGVTSEPVKSLVQMGQQEAVIPVSLDLEGKVTLWPGSVDASGSQFGYSVALSGDTAVVGANLNVVGSGTVSGAAYVFVRANEKWTLQTRLVPTDGADYDSFGEAVAISNDIILVGAPFHNTAGEFSGAVYVFERSERTWAQRDFLRPQDGQARDLFGASVAVSGSYAVIGARGANGDSGCAYVFQKVGNSWSQTARLTASDGAALDRFGYSVAVSGDTTIVSAPFRDLGGREDAGGAYVFRRVDNTWVEQARLGATNGVARDLFGVAVALSDNLAVIGSSRADTLAGVDAGLAYAFVRSVSGWTQEAELLPTDGAAFDQFGSSVAVSGDSAIVGAFTDDAANGVNAGSAYLFSRSTGNWKQRAKFRSSDSAALDLFGTSVALSGGTALIGAMGVDYQAPDTGAAFVLEVDDMLSSDGFEGNVSARSNTQTDMVGAN